MDRKSFAFQSLEKASADFERMMSKKSLKSIFSLFFTLFIILLVVRIFQPDFRFHHSYYLTLHTLLETFTILVSVMVFSVGWHASNENRASNLIFVSTAFLAVGMLDFAHTLSYQGMPDFFTPSDPEKAINFWLIARLTSGLALLAMIVLPWKPIKSEITRYRFLFLSLGFGFSMITIGTFYPDLFPDTFIPGEGLTRFKIGMEYLILSIFVIATVILLIRSRKPQEYDAGNLLGATSLMALSELCFTMYTSVTDAYIFLGHVYKGIAFIFLYRAVVLDFVEQTRHRMKYSEQVLRRNQNWFNTTLTSIYDAVITTDTEGRVTFMNPAAERLTGWALKECAGRSLTDIFQTDDRQVLENMCEKKSQRGSFIESRLKTRFGFYLPIQLSVAPIKFNRQSLGTVIVFRDISERKESEERQNRQVAILEATTDFVVTADAKGRILYLNQAAKDFLGVDETDESDGSSFDHNHPEWAARMIFREGFPIAAREGVWSGETVFLSHKGEEIPVSQVIIAHKNKSGEVEFYSTIARDIRDIKQAEEKELLAGKVLENITESVVVTDADTRIISVNPAFTEITGYMEAEVLGKTPKILSSGRHGPEFYQKMWSAIHRSGRWQGEIWNRRKDGEIYLEGITISVVKDELGNITHYVGVMKDITLRKKLEDQIQYQAYHDTLTGLPNRVLLYDRLKQGIIHARRQNKKLAVMFLDLDRFKRINDTLGHSTGDQLLKAVAERLSGCMGERDTVARQGGDEFIILLPEIEHTGEAAELSSKIIETLKKPFFLENHELFITTSIGISIYPSDGTNLETLIQNADTAMYRAKEQGRNNFQFFTPVAHDPSLERLTLESHMRRSLDKGDFEIYYQPRVDLKSGRIKGMEALVRWYHPELGLLMPDKFIPLAEETGLIIPLGEKVLREACRQNREWQRDGYPDLQVAVNLSMLQFKQPDLAEMIESVLVDTGLDPGCLELEITESIVMNNPDVTLNTLNKLKMMGVKIALDDFGTGYSSLNYLKRFPIDTLKIDRSFVQDVTANQDDRAIVTAMINLAHSLQLKVVAEGVETEEQLLLLNEYHCDEIQGYFCSHPLPADQFSQLILDREGQMECLDG
ncbi:MAG: EAL domain-containing protein [Bacillaceae bacterium]|nr:EAL domain-containing protein [Bacillaceae bacterium]